MEDAQGDRGGQTGRRPDHAEGRPVESGRVPEGRRRGRHVGRDEQEGDARRSRCALAATHQAKADDPEHAGGEQSHGAEHHPRLAVRPTRASHERAPGGQQERAAEVGEDLRDRHARAEQRRGRRARVSGRAAAVDVSRTAVGSPAARSRSAVSRSMRPAASQPAMCSVASLMSVGTPYVPRRRLWQQDVTWPSGRPRQAHGTRPFAGRRRTGTTRLEQLAVRGPGRLPLARPRLLAGAVDGLRAVGRRVARLEDGE